MCVCIFWEECGGGVAVLELYFIKNNPVGLCWLYYVLTKVMLTSATNKPPNFNGLAHSTVECGCFWLVVNLWRTELSLATQFKEEH